MAKSFSKFYSSFHQWFFHKGHPNRRLDLHDLLMDSLWLIASVFIFLVFYKNAIAFNQIALWFIRIGAVVQLVLLYFILRKGYSLIKNLKEGFMGLNNGYKMGLLLILVLICAIIYAHQEAIANWALNLYSNFNFASFNPFKMS